MIRTLKDGRVLLSGHHYTEHKIKVLESQGGTCADCGKPVTFREAHFHHDSGRGLGGSLRDDMDPRNKVICPFPCHARYDKKPQWSRREIES